jgi:hypothetical protein
LAEPVVYFVKDFCGEPPFHFAKSEAVALLSDIDNRSRSQSGEIIFDFSEVSGVSPSGAHVFLGGLVRRFGSDVFSRIIFKNVEPSIQAPLTEAAADV